MTKNNIPRHVGFIPDGNRCWAKDHGLPKEAGYAHGQHPLRIGLGDIFTDLQRGNQTEIVREVTIG